MSPARIPAPLILASYRLDWSFLLRRNAKRFRGSSVRILKRFRLPSRLFSKAIETIGCVLMDVFPVGDALSLSNYHYYGGNSLER